MLMLVGGLLVFISSFFIKASVSSPSGLIDPFVSANSNDINNQDNQIIKSPLGDVVENALAGSKGNYSVVIKNLKTGESYFKNESNLYETGSLYKLWVMAVAYKKIQEGTLPKDELLADDIPNLNHKFGIGPEDAELTSGSIDMTVTEAIKQMITISHNYAALLLTDKIKVTSVESFLKENGFNSSSVGKGTDVPKSSASDIASFWEKLYKGELADQASTAEMLDILKAQTFDDGLPKYLPEQAILANKTGDIGWFKHDSGIVFSEKGDYIIVVMSESESPTGAQDRIALISKAVYEYFNK
ncbi:MAG: class A beta-lactamase-related serine hydrolase [Candidatus Daviesbacteria bacterium]|nr:class A beta-lactamase-related serine hydrolase [Candidatus Daviesbacteria bacterium]